MFTILHTNDFHNRLTEAQAERLRGLRDSVEGAGLLADAGDAVASGNITFRAGGELVHDLMNRARYDIGAVGNREFHFSRIGFKSKLSRASHVKICSNVRAVKAPLPNWTEEEGATVFGGESAELPTVPFHIHESPSGWKVLFVGLTVPMITERMLARKVSAYLFADPVQTAQEMIPLLQERHQPHLVVALTHIGLSRDRALAERVPGVHLIIGGHSHDRLENGERVGETLIVQTGCFGKSVGVVEIERDGSRVRMKARLEAL